MNGTELQTDFYSEWYGPSYRWFFWIEITLGILISISNGLVIYIAISSENIHSHICNWFVVSLAVADFVFGIDKVIFLPFAFIYAERYPIICALEGSVHFISGVVASCAPSMMAACRYYTVTNGLPNHEANILIRASFFAKTGALCLIAGSWLYFFVIVGTLLGFDQMGMSIHGYCGPKPFISLSLFLLYTIGFQFFVYTSTIATIVYSTKLTRFLKEHSAVPGRNEDNDETRELLKMIKIAAAQPFIFQFAPVFVIFLDDLGLIPLPIAWGRVLAIMFALAALIDPWLTLCILAPFRRELVRRFVRKMYKLCKDSTMTTHQHEATRASSRMRAWNVIHPSSA